MSVTMSKMYVKLSEESPCSCLWHELSTCCKFNDSSGQWTLFVQ